MKTYYDNTTHFSIITNNGAIVTIQKRPLFSYDELFICTDETKTAYGQIGTAYHSGFSENNLVEFNGVQNLVNLQGEIKIGILDHYSVCSKTLDLKPFEEKRFYSFYTSETELMPLLGYVVYTEKIKTPNFSLYETENNLQSPNIIIEIEKSLPGDNLGQMAQCLIKAPVFNAVCKTALNNPFYNRTLSAKAFDVTNQTVIVSEQFFDANFKVSPVLKDIAKVYPIHLTFNDTQSILFQLKRADVFIATDRIQAISHVIGLYKYFSGKDFFYACDGKHTKIVCGFNRIVNQ